MSEWCGGGTACALITQACIGCSFVLHFRKLSLGFSKLAMENLCIIYDDMYDPIAPDKTQVGPKP